MNSTFELGDDAARALKPYPAYKDSGIEWLGQVPAHWKLRHLGRIGRLFKGGGGTKEDEREDGIPCVRYGDLYTRHRFFITASRACVAPELAATAYTPIAYGDVLFAGSGETMEEIGKSAVNLIRGQACCGGDVIVFRPSIDAEARFLGYMADCSASVHQKACIGRGFTVMHIYSSDLKYMTVAIPPVPEQAAIARFLDHADRRIGRYIRAKQKLIALLEDQKQAIIHQAVTGQIDVRAGRPYPAYKPSGVEWLGDVPTHWAVRRARYIFREIDERSQEGAEQHLSMSQRLGLVPSHLIENRTLVSESYAGGKLCRTGDLVLNRLKAHLGVFARARQSGVISADYTVLRPNRGAEAEYFEELLRSPSCRGELRIRAKGIVEGFWRLYTDDLYDIYLPLPSEEEQRSIIRWIESVGARIERSSASGNREIVLLYEYSARLIADVVTGKLDVREAAGGLPDVDPLAAEEDPDDGSNLEARLDGDEVDATVHEAEA